MAALVPSNSMEDIASSLTPEELVPSKLKCAMCDRIAFNAFKLPCCAQSICTSCQSALPDTCSICGHTPLSADDAMPLKNVRLTVEQFLKNIKKKRGKARAATSNENPVSTDNGAPVPVVATPAVQPLPTLNAEPSPSQGTAATSIPAGEFSREVIPEADPVVLDVESYWSDSNRNPLPRIPTPASGQYDARVEHSKAPEEQVADENREVQELEASADVDHNEEQKNDPAASMEDNDDVESESSDIQIVTGDEDAKAVTEQPEMQGYEEGWNDQYYGGQMHGQGNGYAGMQGNFAQMGAQMGMSPEMMNFMMQQMQSGGFQNMMNTMPGMMGMDPMAMSAMFGQFGMQGMNGMNPNMMNMSGMNGMMGMDFNGNYGGWNGQQMGGDFGASSGYYPGGGYNQSHQGNFPHMSHHQQFSKNNFHNQNRFSGSQRGFGRGYQNQGYNGRNQSQNMTTGDGPPINAPTGPKAQQQAKEGGFQNHNPLTMHNRSGSKTGSLDDRRGSISHQGSTDGQRNDGPLENGTNNDNNAQVGTSDRDDREQEQTADLKDNANGSLNDNTYLEQNGYAADALNAQEVSLNDTSSWDQANGLSKEGFNQDQRQYGRGGFRGRGGFEGRGSFRGRGGANWQSHGGHDQATSISPAEPLGVGVEGAPTGPKALREGNTRGGRGRGSLNGITREHSHSISSTKPEEYDYNTNSSQPSAYELNSVPTSRPRSRSRSPRRDRSRSRSRHASTRHRSRSPMSDDDDERRRDRKRRRSSRKHDDEYGDIETDERRDRKEKSSRRREDSVEDEYERSRRENDRRRATKTHRETSKERRRRHRKSRSPDRSDAVYDEGHANMEVERSKDKERRRDKDRDKYRDRDRDRSRDRDRDKERHRDRDRDRDRGDRGDRDKKRSSRRDRSASRESEYHRSSRHSKRDKDRRDSDREVRDRDTGESRDASLPKAKTSAPPTPTVITQLQQGFRIHGRSKDRVKTETAKVEETPAASTPIPITEDTTMAPPTGPRADRGSATSKFKLDLGSISTKTSSSSRRPSQSATPTSAGATKENTPIDPYAEERRKAQEARINKEFSRRKVSETTTSMLGRKRSWADTAVGEEVPTGPRERKGKKSRMENEESGHT